MIEQDVVTYLENDSTLYSLLEGTSSDGKIYPIQSYHGSDVPYILYRVSNDGTLEENIKEISITFDCIDDNYSNCKDVRDRISELLDYQDKIREHLTSVGYWIYWSKKTSGSEFKDSELDNFHKEIIIAFKYGIK